MSRNEEESGKVDFIFKSTSYFHPHPIIKSHEP